ncbi:IkappaB kinase complex, IKAP component [Cryphonectria parasitica EP155]|uniref:Elongator complex protein 1 n=1 Tax=Cryphonectria parasitica (strain ATCC 38755 / EP155) TaxID=660469 RepID=A0A9P5CP65_CRYP1|nr:IkappaB kinase complex, IKAP component [Cryphonectria parasitica EP155]KAF3765858.1 IkappaB kinase complex, IKAP component [Cryphonectria parasitica EP155]
MRNLRNVGYKVSKAAADISAICWDASKDETLITCGPAAPDQKIELFRVAEDVTPSWDAPSPNPDLPVDRIVSLHYFSDSATTCLVLEGGDIVIVEEGLGSEDVHIEIMGSIDAGIRAAQWSPDEELLVIATKADTVVFMSRSFDGIAEATMTEADMSASKHVSVGWGKKETQFQGKGAKARALRDPTIPEKVDEGRPSPNDDGRLSVSWRGDGAYVAINSTVSASRRLIRVYTRDGALDGVSEPVDGLEGSLSWRPAGNLMAGIQRFDDHVDVVFFERNGLRHGQFTLRSTENLLDPEMHITLEWNSDSTVLAVLFGKTVQLWTMGNYHWYLKQEILLKSPCSYVSWHPEKALRLAMASTGNIFHTEFVFAVAKGSLMPPHDFGAVAVVDGTSVKITPFRTANVPPPMSMFEIESGHTVIDIAFSQDNSEMAVLHLGGVDVYGWQTKNGRSVVPRLSKRYAFGSDGVEAVLFPQATSIDNSSELLNPGDMCVQSKSGRISRLPGNAEALESLATGFPLQLPWVEITHIDDEMVAFGMSRSGHLYANSRLLVKNCTSFLVTCDHLIFTTSNHFLKFVHLNKPEDLELAPDDPEKDERCRSIERGARLVTAIPTTMSVILQMPRGNLETIYPRAMVLAGIRQLVDEKEYGKAFAHCRTQRVDMNILYDHNPEQFLSNVGLFLDQLKDVTYIDLFLASLSEDDVTETMYTDTKKTKTTAGFIPSAQDTPATTVNGESTSKVNAICDSILKTLQARRDTNLQNIITANVCKNPPALEDGLLVVAQLMQEDESMAEKAVEHICFLQDVNRLYDHALGLYHLDLALLVAQQSQRDPREYLPFIQDLHQKSDARRKFAIDDHLSRRDKALQHLHALNAFDEVKAYTTRYNLYQTALRLYRYETERHRDLTDLYAAHLESQSKYREAGLAYESLNNFARATACYRAAGASCWRECLFTAQQQEPPLSTDAMADLAAALADALWEAKEYASAATVYLEYLDKLDDAVRCLCKGYHFADAMRLVVSRSRADLLASAVDTGLADALSSSTEFLADCKAQLRAQVPRIAELRRKAIEDPLAFYEGERPSALADLPDDVSVASSRVSTSASLFTRYTGKAGSVGTVGSNVSRATSKNRKREEKKRARGRKGTVYEAEYLVNSVRRLVERVEASKGEVERLVFGLMRRGMAERARAIEALMDEIVEACRAAVREGEGYRPKGPDAVLQASLDAVNARQVAPVITAFSKLSLLG